MAEEHSGRRERLRVVDPDGNYRDDRKRIQFDLGRKAADQFEALCEMVEQKSQAEVIRSALRLYDWMVRKRLEGSEIYLKAKGDKRPMPVILPLPGLGHED